MIRVFQVFVTHGKIYPNCGVVNSVQCTLYSVQYTTVYSAQRTAHSAQRTAHSAQRTAHSAQRTVCRVPVYPAEDPWVGGVGGAVGDPVGPVLGEPVLLGDGPQPAPHHRHLRHHIRH